MFQEQRNRTDQLQGEFWRVFLVGMLIFLLAEGALILPARSAGQKMPAIHARQIRTESAAGPVK
jgi:hypothetical protein